MPHDPTAGDALAADPLEENLRAFGYHLAHSRPSMAPVCNAVVDALRPLIGRGRLAGDGLVPIASSDSLLPRLRESVEASRDRLNRGNANVASQVYTSDWSVVRIYLRSLRLIGPS